MVLCNVVSKPVTGKIEFEVLLATDIDGLESKYVSVSIFARSAPDQILLISRNNAVLRENRHILRHRHKYVLPSDTVYALAFGFSAGHPSSSKASQTNIPK